jgi:repressor LexA
MNRIQEILKEQGRSQTWLAEQLGKSYNMVNSYVKNRRQPSLDILYRIADILAIDAKDLLVSSMAQEDENNTTLEIIKVPLLGDVACGIPILAEENIKAEIPISAKLLNSNQQYFILRASGTSMNLAGIQDGDLVLIKQQPTAENGDKVVALIDDDATIKEYHHQGDMIVLIPKSNDNKHQPIILTEDFKIQGVVERVMNF